jgi:hypothetical protein
MRKALGLVLGAVAALAMMSGLIKHATRHNAAELKPEPRQAGADELNRAHLSAEQIVKSTSLWASTAGLCIIPAAYGPGVEPARFSPLMRLSLPMPALQRAVVKSAPVWAARAEPRMTQPHDADVAAGYARQSGQVRFFRAASYRPLGAALGEERVLEAA